VPNVSDINLLELERYNVTSFSKDVYLMILRGIFGENPGEFHWDPDPEVSKLHISDRMEAPKDEQTFKPTIYLVRGRMGFANLSINDQMLSMNMSTGATRHADLINGSMIVNCASTEGLEAEHLASLVFVLLSSFRKTFQKYGFHQLKVGEILEERVADASVNTKIVEVGVTTSFSFSYGWMVGVMNATLLKDICLTRKTQSEGGVCDPDEDGLYCGPFGPIKTGSE
jgi:hypothetical protein